MNNTILQFKVKERLNKLDSKDFSNIDCFKITEAFNKFQLDWARAKAASGEMFKQSVEDLQLLLKDGEIKGTNKEKYFESLTIPEDFLSMSVVEAFLEKDGCKDSIVVELLENGNTGQFLAEFTTQPSFEWRQSFYTMVGDKLRIYTNDDFSVLYTKITYFRKPKPIAIEGCEDEFGNGVLDSECEFKDDVVEFLIQGTCAIIAGDIENFNQVARLSGGALA